MRSNLPLGLLVVASAVSAMLPLGDTPVVRSAATPPFKTAAFDCTSSDLAGVLEFVLDATSTSAK